MAVQHLPVGPVGGGGAVGVQHEAPAAAVDGDVLVELAQLHAVADGCLAAVGFVLQVVDVAPGGGPAAAWPGAAAVAEEDGAAAISRLPTPANPDPDSAAECPASRRGLLPCTIS